jgi:hypothetical protein
LHPGTSSILKSNGLSARTKKGNSASCHPVLPRMGLTVFH